MITDKKIDFFFDFETRSRLDLKKVGAVNYATDSSTEATLITWCFGRTGEIKYWRLGQPMHNDLKDVMSNPSKYNLVAHNLLFDYLIWTQSFSKNFYEYSQPKIEDLTDSMALTCHFRVGASLEAAAKILKMPMTKDPVGRRIMLKQCKPNSRTKQFPELSEEEWEHFIRYGIIDTKLLRDIYYSCPALTPSERFAWEWTFKRNLKGIKVDMNLLNVMNDTYESEKPKLFKRFEFLTNYKAVPSSPKKCLDFFKQYFPHIDNMRKDTVRDMLMEISEGSFPPHVVEALQIKESIGSTSLSKISAGMNLNHSGRIYELLAYHYAQTKRWAGRGIQVQNFPRPVTKGKDALPDNLNVDDLASAVRAQLPSVQDPATFCKNLLRRIWIPDDGMDFYCGDWSKIEPTVLFWLVGLGRIPKLWYEDMAATIYGLPLEDIGSDSEERNVGKSTNLGCGYGMGPKKFRVDTYTKTGILLSEDMSKRAVYAYRDKYKEVVMLWRSLEYAFKNALMGSPTNMLNGKVFVSSFNSSTGCKNIRVRLPSGGFLFYHDVKYNVDDGLTYLSDDGGGRVSRSKLYGGMLTEHVVSAIARELIVPSIYHLETAGYEVLCLVHDEIWAQKANGNGEQFEKLMCIVPNWCSDMVIGAESKNGRRYLK